MLAIEKLIHVDESRKVSVKRPGRLTETKNDSMTTAHGRLSEFLLVSVKRPWHGRKSEKIRYI
jgi:hypothetical protein